jgi:hypothetical protein
MLATSEPPELEPYNVVCLYLTQKRKFYTNTDCRVGKLKVIFLNFAVTTIYASTKYMYVQNISFCEHKKACR